jgi:hypothetical protein
MKMMQINSPVKSKWEYPVDESAELTFNKLQKTAEADREETPMNQTDPDLTILSDTLNYGNVI